MQSYFQFKRSERKLRQQISNTAVTAATGGAHCLSPNTSPLTTHAADPSQIEETRESDQFIILEFDEGDDLNPRNWSFSRKASTTMFVLSTGIVGGWASSVDSTIVQQATQSFGVSDVTESLATGLYLVAFGVGSLVCGPFSETVGRNPVYIITLVLFMLSVMASGLAPDIGSQLVFRFFAGLLGCTAVTTFAGTVADLWAPNERSLVFTLASLANFSGIFIAPCVGSFIGQSPNLSWRWTEWITLLMSAVALVLIVFLARETYAPVILSWKAKQMRSITQKQYFRSRHEMQLEPLWKRLKRSVYRPFDLFRREITVVLFTAYLTVLYVVSFSFLNVYPILYGGIYGFSQGSVGLCFLGLVVGILLAGASGIPIHLKYIRDLAKHKELGGEALPPESRLLLAMITSPCLPIGIFWMGWTSNESINYWISLVGSVFVGAAFLGIFVGTYLYLIDSFESLAASALAIATFCRYVAAGAMISVSIPMFKNLGVHWAMTILGCISLILTPVPFVFYKCGERIRKRSRSANEEGKMSI